MWNKIMAINKMNQELANSIQKKKKLRHKLKEMKQKKENQEMNDLTEWALSEAKSLINDIEHNEKTRIPYIENEHKSANYEDKATLTNLNQDIKAIEIKPEFKVNESKAPQQMISGLFLNDIVFGDNISNISTTKSSDSEDKNDGNTQDLENKNLEALRKRIDKMKSNKYEKRSLKCVVQSILFIEYLKKMVDEHRPKMAIEFERNLSQIIKPYQTLTCNYLKLYSLSVFRSIQRSKISLNGFNTKRILWIRVHILKLIECFNKYLQVLDDSLIEFFNSHLLNDKPALFKYCFVNETDLLQFDKHHFVINYSFNQKRMILLNFIAIRCMLIKVIFEFVQHHLSNESTQKSNLFTLASIFYYIVRKYNTKLLQCENLIEQDTEITELFIRDKFPKEKLLSDNHSIYDSLQDVIQDGINKIEVFLDKLMTKIDHFYLQ